MKIVRIAALILAILVGLFILGGLLLPAQVSVERSIEIDASPPEVFALINDLEAFNRWSPWAVVDSQTRYEFSGPDSGVGARMSWSSDNPEVGSGSQEIVRSRPSDQVVLMLDFGQQGGAQARFDLQPLDEGTKVTWAFGYDTGYNLVGRYLGLLMEPLVGGKYQQGLVRLKALVETGQPEGLGDQ